MATELIRESPKDFMLDSEERDVVGVTHSPSGFRFHLPREVAQPLFHKMAASDEDYIAVDLDGTLAKYDGWKGPDVIGDPIPKMVERIRRTIGSGKNVKIFTARVAGDNDGIARRAIKKWCRLHLGFELPITCIKDRHCRAIWDDIAKKVYKNTGSFQKKGRAKKFPIDSVRDDYILTNDAASASVFDNGEYKSVSDVYTEPSQRGRGYASKVLKKIVKDNKKNTLALRAGPYEMDPDTYEEVEEFSKEEYSARLVALMALYRKHGFVEAPDSTGMLPMDKNEKHPYPLMVRPPGRSQKIAKILLDINVGDILLGGRFKNQRTEVKEIGTDDLGQPTINDRKLLSYRIEKKMPMKKRSKATQEASQKVACGDMMEYFAKNPKKHEEYMERQKAKKKQQKEAYGSGDEYGAVERWFPGDRMPLEAMGYDEEGTEFIKDPEAMKQHIRDITEYDKLVRKTGHNVLFSQDRYGEHVTAAAAIALLKKRKAPFWSQELTRSARSGRPKEMKWGKLNKAIMEYQNEHPYLAQEPLPKEAREAVDMFLALKEARLKIKGTPVQPASKEQADAVSGTLDGISEIGKSIGDGVLTDTKLLGDRSDTESFIAKRAKQGEIDVDSMKTTHMLGPQDQREVFDPVVKTVPVYMVDSLISSKEASEMSLHDKAVLSHSPASNGDVSILKPVGLIRDLLPCLPGSATPMATKEAGLSFPTRAGLKSSTADSTSLQGFLDAYLTTVGVGRVTNLSGGSLKYAATSTTSKRSKVSGKHVSASVGGYKVTVNVDPTEAQIKAGVYKKGHTRMHGLDVTIENLKGQYRKGTSSDGTEWKTLMKHHYGYIKRTLSQADGDHVDVFIGPDTDSEMVFVVNQTNEGGKGFDEHKCMMGFTNTAAAKKGYLDNYEKGWTGCGSITPLTMDQFKKWVTKGNTGRPLKPLQKVGNTEHACSVSEVIIKRLGFEDGYVHKNAADQENVKELERLSARELTRAIRGVMVEEHNAVKQYETIADSTQNRRAADILQGIADEEKVHVGELEGLLEELDPQDEEFRDEGEEEIEDMPGAPEEKEASGNSWIVNRVLDMIGR